MAARTAIVGGSDRLRRIAGSGYAKCGIAPVPDADSCPALPAEAPPGHPHRARGRAAGVPAPDHARRRGADARGDRAHVAPLALSAVLLRHDSPARLGDRAAARCRQRAASGLGRDRQQRPGGRSAPMRTTTLRGRGYRRGSRLPPRGRAGLRRVLGRGARRVAQPGRRPPAHRHAAAGGTGRGHRRIPRRHAGRKPRRDRLRARPGRDAERGRWPDAQLHAGGGGSAAEAAGGVGAGGVASGVWGVRGA